MKIGIDIDGVLQDTERYFEAYANIFDYDNGGRGVVHPEEYKASRRYDWSEEEFIKFIDQYMYNIMESAPIMAGAEDIVKRLKADGHQLYIITARGILFEHEKEIADDFLARLGVEFDGIYYGCRDKLPACIDAKIDYMIDDAPYNVTHLSENGIKCLFFRSSCVDDIINDNVNDVYNWGDVYKFFKSVNV